MICPNCGVWTSHNSSVHLCQTTTVQPVTYRSIFTTTAPAPERKPDGWHTYHICDGELRELVWERTTGAREALCVACGEWFRAETWVRVEDPA